MEDMYILLYVMLALIILGAFAAVIATTVWRRKKEAEIREKITALSNNALEMTPEEFFEMRSFSFGGRGRPQVSQKYNFAGVYILFNKTKNMYYVGKGQNVMNRVNNHFTGKGNGDVYADYKYGSIGYSGNHTVRRQYGNGRIEGGYDLIIGVGKPACLRFRPDVHVDELRNLRGRRRRSRLFGYRHDAGGASAVFKPCGDSG